MTPVYVLLFAFFSLLHVSLDISSFFLNPVLHDWELAQGALAVLALWCTKKQLDGALCGVLVAWKRAVNLGGFTDWNILTYGAPLFSFQDFLRKTGDIVT